MTQGYRNAGTCRAPRGTRAGVEGLSDLRERDPGVELLAVGLNALQQDAALPNFSRPCQGLVQVVLRLKRLAIQTQQHGPAADAFVRPFARSHVGDDQASPDVQTRLDLGR